jgi:hypothetical protein
VLKHGKPKLVIKGEEVMRQTTILTLLLAAVMSVALFYLKYEVTIARLLLRKKVYIFLKQNGAT